MDEFASGNDYKVAWVIIKSILNSLILLNYINVKIEYLHIELNFSDLSERSNPTEDDGKVKPKVSMVCWDRSDKYVVTAVHDATLKVWDSYTGK